MSWSEKRIVTILSIILAVLMAALLIVFSIRYREKKQAQLENPGMTTVQGEVLDKHDYTGLYIENGNTALTFSLGDTGKWIWADEPSFPLNDETVLAVLDLLDNIQPQQTLPMEGGPEAYALESPRATVEGTRADGSVRSIHLGKATTDGTSYYAMIDGSEETVYILPGTLYELLQTPIYDMCRLPQLPKLEEDQLTSLSIQGSSPDAAPLVLEASHEKRGETVWTENGRDVTENARLQALLEDIFALELTRCVDFAPSEKAVEICGLTTPSAILNIGYMGSSDTEQTLQIQVGTRLTDGSGRYIRVNSDDTIYFLPTERLDPLMAIAAGGLNG